MTTTAQRVQASRKQAPATRGWVAPAWRTLALASTGLCVWAAVRALSDGVGAGTAVGSVLALAWAVAAVVVAFGWPGQPLALVAAAGAGLAALGTLSDSLAPIALGLVPFAAMHLLLGLPEGRLLTSGRRGLTTGGYAAGMALAVIYKGAWPDVPAVAIGAEIILAVAVGTAGAAARFPKCSAVDRRRMKWLAWALTLAAGFAVAVVGLRVLVDWPHNAGLFSEAGTVGLPLALILGSSKRLSPRIDSLLAHSISLAGLLAVVMAVYLAVVLGLGRAPHHRERLLLVLSMAAAALAALLYVPTRSRLKGFASRVAYGERRAPEDLVRTFGTRQSRAIPLEELLLQLVEGLRKSLAVSSAEVWTASAGTLERSVSDPERGHARIRLNQSEETTVARAGVSGPAWIRVWLPGLLARRDGVTLRVAPITHSGELLGLLVVERPEEGSAFGEEDDRILTELARQVGLTLHNVRLDSALQSSLDEVRRQAEELQASRGRIVAAADAERRRIERNLHDGAQQHLVALAVKVRLAKQLADRDPARSTTIMDELGGDVETALQELRDLAHGIYPPLLADRGLPEALASAARRAALPTEVEAAVERRFPMEVEAAVYFCCLEALQNAGKHAGEDATARVRVWQEAGGLLFEVSDNGAGFDVGHKGTGAGFTNMGDRLGAIGGSLRVDSAPGRGTRIRGTIPVRPSES